MSLKRSGPPKRYKELDRRSTLKPGQPLAKIGRKKKSKRRRRAEVVLMAMKRDSYSCQALPRIMAMVNAVRSTGGGDDPRLLGYVQQILAGKDIPIVCHGPLDPHEIIQRSVWTDGDLVLENVIIVCRRHHDWIDRNQGIARLLGLHAESWERFKFGG